MRRRVGIPGCCPKGGSILFALLVCLSGAAYGASSPEVIAWFRQAQMFERIGRNDQAAALYRRIWQAEPARVDAPIRGAQLLLDLNRGAEAVAWLGEATARSPDEALLWVEYGDALDRTGKPAQADSAWARGALAAENPVIVYLGVTDRLLSRSDLPRALAWAERGTAASGNPTLFSRRLFTIELAMRRYASAARHAAAYVGSAADRVSEITDALGQATLSRQARDSMAVVAVALSDSETSDAGRALLAAELALLAGMRSDAGRCYVRSASASRDPVNALFGAAGRLDERGYGDVAAMLYDALVKTYPRTPLAQRSAYLAATRYEQWGQPEAALWLYRWLLSQGRSRYEDDARLALGHLLLEAGDLPGAQKHFAEAARAGQSLAIRRQATFGLAECALRTGRLEEAETQWIMLARDADAFPDAAKAGLRLAELAMYRGDAAALQDRCEAILHQSPADDEANDCLALTGILAEAGPDTMAWKTYGRLRYLLDVGKPDSVLAGVNRLARSPLAGRGLLLAAEAELAKSNPQAAAESLLVVVARFDATPLGDEAQWKLAEVYRVYLHDPVRALRAYETLLQRFPESVYTGPARRWVRRLREETGAT